MFLGNSAYYNSSYRPRNSNYRMNLKIKFILNTTDIHAFIIISFNRHNIYANLYVYILFDNLNKQD